ncbi:MAG: metal-dependent hydrolase [Deltaproteobacteria bacterium]|nr:metal-dependent hydrolase [Deltaproteobacteria bacterium]
MPSVITHAAVAVAAGLAFGPRDAPSQFWTASIACSVLPDMDILAFSFGIPYGHFFGHRGFFHSPFFAMILSLLMVILLFNHLEFFSKQWFFFLIFFFLVGASHGLLDAFTNGGLGVALLSPFTNERYFFPWRPIMVSPIGIQGLFSKWGLMVLKTELLWVWLPCSLMVLFSYISGWLTRKG